MDLKIVILVILVADFSCCFDDIHKFMTAEEVQQVFNTNHENVPEHEVIKVYLSKRFKNDPNERESTWKREKNSKRDVPIGSVIKTRAFGRNIKLWLVPYNRALIGTWTPVYKASSAGASNAPQGVFFYRISNPFYDVIEILKNRRKSASFTVRRDLSGSSRINGFIGSENLVIKSLPKSVIEKYGRKRRSLDDSDDSLDSFDHVVYRSQTNDKSINLFPPEIKVKLVERQAGSGIPEVLYPEILVVVDNSLYRTFGSNTNTLLEYLVNLWNGVDLKYRSLESPAIRLHISGIIIATDYEATPYIANNMLNNRDFDRFRAMDDAQKFFYGIHASFPIGSYDIAVTLTHLRMSNALGIANIGGACKVFHYKYETWGIALVHDNAAFMGVHLVAHELGHSLGAEHDDTADCPETSNFIMKPGISNSRNSSEFSSCSLASFQDQIKSGSLTCLYNKPNQVGRTLPIVLPGQIINRNLFCKNEGYFGSEFFNIPGIDQCSYVYCRTSPTISLTATAISSAFDGTECDPSNRSKFCLHQKCVSLND